MQVAELDRLKRSGALWQGRRQAPAVTRVLASGWTVLDELLGGGWPRAALVEVFSEKRQGLSLLLPAMAQLSTEPRWITWVAPPYVPYAPALAARGIDIGRLLLVSDVSGEQALWAAEQVLKSGAGSLLLAWPGSGRQGVKPAELRRLQLAAEQGDCIGVLFRPLRDAVGGSNAALRLRVRPEPLGLQVEVLKRRGSWAGGSCIVPMHERAAGQGPGARVAGDV
jgi:cell division inhibitor SulA/protein ImuA